MSTTVFLLSASATVFFLPTSTTRPPHPDKLPPLALPLEASMFAGTAASNDPNNPNSATMLKFEGGGIPTWKSEGVGPMIKSHLYYTRGETFFEIKSHLYYTRGETFAKLRPTTAPPQLGKEAFQLLQSSSCFLIPLPPSASAATRTRQPSPPPFPERILSRHRPTSSAVLFGEV
jgi:hypothetical protein